jgi:transposase
MNRRFEVTDDEWERLAPLLPAMTPRRGGRWRDHRQVLNGILFRVRSGVPWRDLPERYGPWETVYKRFARWPTDGTWARIEAALPTQADGAGELDWHAQIDSTVVRAHQHAAGARQGGSRRSRQAASRRWGGHGWADHQAPHHHRAGAQQATAAQATLLARRPPAQPSAPWPAVTIPDRQAGVSPHHRCGWNIRIAAKLSVGTVKQPQSPWLGRSLRTERQSAHTRARIPRLAARPAISTAGDSRWCVEFQLVSREFDCRRSCRLDLVADVLPRYSPEACRRKQ